MIDLWLAPMRAAAEMQRRTLAMMTPPPMAAMTFPGDLARMMLPWAAWMPVVQAAAGTLPGPWAGLRVQTPMGTCGVVAIGGRG